MKFQSTEFESPEPETTTIPEEYEKQVPYENIKQALLAISIEDFETFEFDGKTSQIFFCGNDEKGRPLETGSPIEIHASTTNDGWDIYIWDRLKNKGENFLRAFLIHELAEIAIFNRDTINPNDDQRRRIAHQAAIIYENKFANENLTPEQQKEFTEFTQQYRNN